MIAIFDLDGTLAHMDDRRTPFEWDKVHLDRIDPVVARQARMHHYVQDTVLIVSGRDAVCRPATEHWLLENEIRYEKLFMRPTADFRDDRVVKREIWDTLIVPEYKPLPDHVVIYDDRDKVVAMWRELGLKVLQVAPGNF